MSKPADTNLFSYLGIRAEITGDEIRFRFRPSVEHWFYVFLFFILPATLPLWHPFLSNLDSGGQAVAEATEPGKWPTWKVLASYYGLLVLPCALGVFTYFFDNWLDLTIHQNNDFVTKKFRGKAQLHPGEPDDRLDIWVNRGHGRAASYWLFLVRVRNEEAETMHTFVYETDDQAYAMRATFLKFLSGTSFNPTPAAEEMPTEIPIPSPEPPSAEPTSTPPRRSLKQHLGQTWKRVWPLVTFIWVICGFIACFGVYLHWEFRKLDKEGVSTVAYVTKIESIPRTNGNANKVDRVSVSFETPDKGKQVESIIRGEYSPYGLKIGDPVNIRYLPEDPSILKEEPLADAGSFALYGALAMACAAVLIYVIALFRKRPAEAG